MNNVYSDAKGRYEIPVITIEKIDQALFDYLDKKLDITVDAEKDNRKKVQILWSIGERWKLIRKNKFRDENSTLILPLISIKRTDVNFDTNFGGLGTQVPYLVVEKNIHSKTSNIMNLVKERKLNGFPQVTPPSVQTTLTIPFPTFCTIFYQIEIWSQYEQQNNEILEKIFNNYEFKRVSQFVMPIDYDSTTKQGNGFYVLGFREGNVSPQGNNDDMSDQERLIKYQYTIKVPTYLTVDSKDQTLSYGKDENGKNIIYEQQSQNQISMKEQILSLEEFEKKFG